MNNFDLEINAENIKDTISKNILGRNKKLVMLAKMLDNQKNNAIIAIDGTEMERWIKELLQCKTEDYKQLIIKCYEKIINGEKNIHVTPFLEAISMLGTRIQIDDES